MKGKLSETLQKFIVGKPIFFVVLRFVYYLRLKVLIKPAVRRAVRDSSGLSEELREEGRPLVIVPLLETNHYQHIHVLLMAKAFERRGYRVLVIACDEYLPACELKSCRNENDRAPCRICTMNRQEMTGSFGLEVILLSDILSSTPDVPELGKDVLRKYSLRTDVIDLIVEDSTTRYFY